MNGVVLLDSLSGTLLYSQSYAANFGLPTGESGRAMDELNLSSMLFALFINSRAVVVPVGQEGGLGSGLQLYDIGHTTMHFCHDDGEHVLCVAFVESVMGYDHGRDLAQCILHRFVDKYFGASAVSAGPNRSHTKLRPAKSLMRGIFQEWPARIFQSQFSHIEPELRPSWIFCAMSEEFMAQVDWDDFLDAERSAKGRPGDTDAAQNSECAASYG